MKNHLIYYRFKFKCYTYLYYFIINFCRFLRKILNKAIDKSEEIFEKARVASESIIEALNTNGDKIK